MQEFEVADESEELTDEPEQNTVTELPELFNEAKPEKADAKADEIDEAVAAGKPRRKIWKRVFLILICAVVLVVAGEFAAVHMKYHLAVRSMKQGEYESANEQFLALGEFKDAENRAYEARKMMRYEEGKTFMEQEEFDRAYVDFNALGDFLDAPQLAADAREMMLVKSRYDSAHTAYTLGDLQKAYLMFEEISEVNYKDTLKLMEAILNLSHAQVLEHVAAGENLEALEFLEFLESKGYGAADELREELRQQEYIEFDYSHYDLKLEQIESFNEKTVPEQYAAVFVDMLLTGTTSVTLPAYGCTGPYSEHAINEIIDRSVEGYRMADELLPEYDTVYQQDYTTVYWDNYRPESMVMEIAFENPYSEDELREQMEGIKVFCEESVRALNDAGLLGRSMSNRQKANVIYAWVCYYLTYDDTLEIHNTYLAIEKKLGVCESYVGLYNRMCNLVGIPSYGQIGETDNAAEGETHIWSVQQDEDGSIFYTDATWGDGFMTDFSQPGAEHEPTVEGFVDYCMENSETGWYNVVFKSAYFWQEDLWDSHIAQRETAEIITRFQ